MLFEVEVNGRLRQVVVHRAGRGFVVTVDGSPRTVDAAHVDAHTLSLLIEQGVGGGEETACKAGSSHEVTIVPDPASGLLSVRVGAAPLAVALNGRGRLGRKDDGADAASGPQRVVAPMPGKIVRVLVQPGQAVHARQPLLVIEAMKMENELRANGDGTVAEVHVRDGESVEAGALLAVVAAVQGT